MKKKWLSICLCAVMLVSLASCGSKEEKTLTGPYADMSNAEWKAMWNEAESEYDSYEKNFEKQKGDYEMVERDRVSAIDSKFMEYLPKAYFSDVEENQKGKIDKVSYDTYDYLKYQDQGIDKSEWEKETKNCYVYTPAGYDESQKYDVYYLLHRKNYSEDYWFISTVTDGTDRELGKGDFVYLLDFAIANDLIEPAIFVACTAKIGEAGDEMPEYQSENFGYELVNDLIPAIDEKYSTYASREHRALGGASRGGLLVWGAMPVALSEVAYFAPICNGCIHTVKTSEQKQEADRLCELMNSPENSEYDISYLFAFAGDCDNNKLRVYSTYDEVMNQMSGRLEWGKNTYYGKPKYGTHTNKYFYLGVYESMQVFFKDNDEIMTPAEPNKWMEEAEKDAAENPVDVSTQTEETKEDSSEGKTYTATINDSEITLTLSADQTSVKAEVMNMAVEGSCEVKDGVLTFVEQTEGNEQIWNGLGGNAYVLNDDGTATVQEKTAQ